MSLRVVCDDPMRFPAAAADTAGVKRSCRIFVVKMYSCARVLGISCAGVGRKGGGAGAGRRSREEEQGAGVGRRSREEEQGGEAGRRSREEEQGGGAGRRSREEEQPEVRHRKKRGEGGGGGWWWEGQKRDHE
jgi:hypothetical protein